MLGNLTLHAGLSVITCQHEAGVSSLRRLRMASLAPVRRRLEPHPSHVESGLGALTSIDSPTLTMQLLWDT